MNTKNTILTLHSELVFPKWSYKNVKTTKEIIMCNSLVWVE